MAAKTMDSQYDNVIIIIPAFNEQENIVNIITAIKELLPRVDVLVIDDGSADETVQRARGAGALVLSHPFNLGYGVALQTGYKFALEHDFEYLVQMDGDGQHDPKYIRTLLKPCWEEKADLVIGSRFNEENDYKMDFVRRIGVRFFSFIALIIMKKRFTDPTSGFQAMTRKVIDFFSKDIYPHDYPDADVLIMIHRAGFRIQEIPIRMFRKKGKSMHSGLKPIYYVFKMSLSVLVTTLRREEKQGR